MIFQMAKKNIQNKIQNCIKHPPNKYSSLKIFSQQAQVYAESIPHF
jgi:hypothetical protein